MKTSEKYCGLGFILVSSVLLLSACGKESHVTEKEHLDRAKSYQAKGQFQAQVIEIKNLLQKNPNHPEGHFYLGETYANLGYGIDAEKELRRAQELGIDPERIKVPLGKSLLDQKEYKRVLNEIRPAIASSPATVAGIKTLYAQAELGMKQYEKGCEMFREAKQADSKYVPAYWGIAQCSLGFGKPIEAAEELDAAIKLDEKNAESWLLRGDLWRVDKNNVEAEKAYTTGLSIQPAHLMLLLSRASVRVLNNNHPGAFEDIAAADKQYKDHPFSLHLRGAIFYKDKKYAEAKTAFENVLRVNPEYIPSILWLGMSDFALNNLEQAGHSFTKYVSAVPNASDVRALLAVTKARLGGKKEAADSLAALNKIDNYDPQTLALIGQANLLVGDKQASARFLSRAIEKMPERIDPRINLVAALLQKGDVSEALAQAEEMVKQSRGDPRAIVVLISTHIESGEPDKAFEIIKQLEEKMPNSPMPHIYRAAVFVKLENLKAAKAELESALKIQPDNVLAGHSLAAVAIKQKDFSEARRRYQHLREKIGDQYEILMAMYDLEVLAKDAKAARNFVETASKKYPRAARPAAIIAAAYTRSGLPRQALELSAEAASVNPDDPELLSARGAAFIDLGELSNAVANYKRIVRLRPELVEGHVKLAMVQEATGDFAGLKDSLQTALRTDPKHRRARLMLAMQHLRDKKFEETLKIANTVEQDFPEGIDAHVLQSNALRQLKREAEAIAVLERAQKAAPQSEIPIIELAKFKYAARQSDQGIRLLNDWLQQHPKNIVGRAFLAESYLGLKKPDEALEIYRGILKIEPDNLIALNNIATLLGEKDPKLGLPHAEKAYALFPVDPSITDTLGWLLLKTGETKRGLELIKKALDASPTTPDFIFHHAAGLAQIGEKEKAKRELEKLLKNKQEFSSRSEAQALFATL